MKFKVYTSSDCYTVGNTNHNALKYVKQLEQLGFEFSIAQDKWSKIWSVEKHPIIEINTIEELMSLIKKFNCSMIVSENNILIYDGDIE